MAQIQSESRRSRTGSLLAVIVLFMGGFLLGGCAWNEGAQSRLPTSHESRLRREVSKQAEDSGFPSAQQTGAPRAAASDD